MEILIITGLSGSGKSQVGNILEDIGYYCIDNMPPTLIPIFAEMASQLSQFQKVAIVTDMRAGGLFSGFSGCLDELMRMGVSYKILFLDASDDVIARRYRETRRSHPLSVLSDSPILDAINEERKIMSHAREIADYYIDTTQLSASQLREMVQRMFLQNSNDSLRVTCISFGFKHGIPPESNIVMDVRFLPNPFYILELKEKTGLDAAVDEYVFSSDNAKELLVYLTNMIDYLLPLYQKEGKSQLVISIGCTGGKHRSVAIIERLAEHIRVQGYPVYNVHRDIEKLL